MCYFGGPRKKICWMSKEGTESPFWELSFEVASSLSLQWFCKLSFPDSTFVEFKALVAECVTLEGIEKKSVECRSKEQRSQFSELSFELALTLSHQWFCKTPFPDSTFVEFKVLIAECYFGGPREKMSWMSRQGKEKSIFRVIFRIGFVIITTMIL